MAFGHDNHMVRTISQDHLLSNDTPTEEFHIEDSVMSSSLRSHISSWFLAISTCVSVAFTIFFAYNCTLEKPISQVLIFSKPERTILTLTILSQITIFLMGHLTDSLFEMVRWGFASVDNGIPALSFFSLGRSTTPLGVIMIIAKAYTYSQSWFPDGPILWGCQRILYTLIRGALGIILLSDVSFTTTYPVVYESTVLQSGISPLNASVLTPYDSDAVSEFWWNFPSLITDQAIIRAVSPLTCNNCTSYFLPGAMTTVKFDPNLPLIGKHNFTEAGAFIVNDAPGYQIDYSTVSECDPPLLQSDCQTYGMYWEALLICIKQVGNSFIGALNVCPKEFGDKFSCLNDTDWTNNTPFTYKITVTKRRATTVFDRYNYTILDIMDISDNWEQTEYGPDDFFPIFNDIFTVNISNPRWSSTTQYAFLSHVCSYFSSRLNFTAVSGAHEGLTKLMSLFAEPIVEFNNVIYGGPVPDDLGKRISLATISYRVIIKPYSTWTFAACAGFMCVWSLIVLTVCTIVPKPKSSQYPDIEIAAKLVGPSDDGKLFFPLSNAKSSQIIKQIGGSRLYLRMSRQRRGGHISIKTQPGGYKFL